MADETTSTENSATETAQSETALGGGEVETTSTATEAGEETALGGKAEGEAATETTEGKTDEKVELVIPDVYELVATDTMPLDPAMIEMATPFFKDAGLTNEAANKLMPAAAKLVEHTVNSINTEAAQIRASWLTTAKADPEIGGQHWDATIATAAKALDGLGLVKGSPFRVLLDESGLGNHPEMIRAFVKVGKAIGEDGFVAGSGTVTKPKTDAEILYPKMTGQE